jgi:hypothetical protein
MAAAARRRQKYGGGSGGWRQRVAMAEAVGGYESGHKGIRRWANGRPQNTEGPFELLENNPTEDRPSESVVETSP